jgi:hypothetical protein
MAAQRVGDLAKRIMVKIIALDYWMARIPTDHDHLRVVRMGLRDYYSRPEMCSHAILVPL